MAKERLNSRLGFAFRMETVTDLTGYWAVLESELIIFPNVTEVYTIYHRDLWPIATFPNALW